MKKVLLAVGLIGALALSVGAEDMTVSYEFQSPELQKRSLAGQVYDWVHMDGIDNNGLEGQPCLPVASARILLPNGHDVSEIRVQSLGEETLGKGHRVAPAQRSYPLSWDPSRMTLVSPDPAVYASSQPFPGHLFEQATVQHFRGYSILILRLYPVQYTPLSGELVYHRELKVQVTTKPGTPRTGLHRGFTGDENEIARRIDNPESIATYPGTSKRAGNVDMLIITLPSLVGAFVPLEEHHDSTGIVTDIVTTADIGSNAPQAVRDYIRDRYLTDGISYVLIGADHDGLPALKAFDPYEGNGGPLMPVDIYFGCLDGTWDYDGDGIPGEVGDGPDGGEVDLTAEVYVGRAAVDDDEQASRFVTKTLKYLRSERPYLEKVLLIGEHLGFGGPSEYGTESMLELVDSSCVGHYCTYGIPDSRYAFDSLFDSEDWYWTRVDLYNRVNSGVHIINHLGHCNTNYAMKLTSTRLTNFENTDHFFAYSHGCFPGAFDASDCWAEVATVGMDEGAFALIMNCRYGLGRSYSTNSPAQKFNRQFWDAVFNPEEDKPQLGRALQDAKEEWLHLVGSGDIRYTYYELILFGDPTVGLKSDRLLLDNDASFGWAPVAVNFEGDGWTGTYAYLWDFGDGTMSDQKYPSHVYQEPGLYDVRLVGFTPEGTVFRTKTGCVAVLGDTLIATCTSADTARGTSAEICVTNHIPLRRLEIPICYDGPLDLILDSTSIAGCRTQAFNIHTYTHWAPGSKLATVLLESTGGAEAPALLPGSGPVLRLYFHASHPEVGQQTDLDLSGYGTFEPFCRSDYGSYRPELIPGWVRFSGCCCGLWRGDVDYSGRIDISDVIGLSRYMYRQAMMPACMDEADIDASGELDILDLVYLVNYMFRQGPPPEVCP